MEGGRAQDAGPDGGTHNMVVTFETAHFEMSALKASALLNIPLRE